MRGEGSTAANQCTREIKNGNSSDFVELEVERMISGTKPEEGAKLSLARQKKSRAEFIDLRCFTTVAVV